MWIGRLADIDLQQGDAAADWRAHRVGTTSANLGDALLGARQLAAQRLKLSCRYRRELLELVARLAGATLQRGCLLGHRAKPFRVV